MTESGWRPIIGGLYPWCQTFNRIMQSLHLSRLDGPMIFVASDYAGTAKASLYETFSVLYVDAEASRIWASRTREIRQRLLPDNRRMAYKSLGDVLRQRAIVPFLSAADEIAGLCIVLAIHKRSGFLHSDPSRLKEMSEQMQFVGKWTHRQIEKMICVTHLISFLIGGLSWPGQNIYWISDEDDLLANLSKSNDTAKLVSAFTSFYANHPLGELGVGTTAIDEGDRFEEDLAAIPDLAAGAIAEVITALAQACGGAIPYYMALPFSGQLSPKAKLVSGWFFSRAGRLQKIVITMDKRPDKSVSAFRFDMYEEDLSV